MLQMTLEVGARSELDSEPDRIDETDLFVGACGADDRAYEALEDFVEICDDFDALFFRFHEREERPVDYMDRYERFRELVDGPDSLRCSLSDRTCGMREFMEYLSSLPEGTHVGIDMSVFTKPYFFAALKGLELSANVASVDIYYTEPKRYRKTEFKYELTKGGYEVTEAPGFGGRLVNARPELLVVQLGFEGRLARIVNEELAPREVAAVNGFPSYLLHYKDTSLVRNSEFLSEAVDDRLYYATASDPFEMHVVLDEIHQEISEEFATTIVPLGTKPMALGAALFGLDNEDVRIVVPRPRRYEPRVSDSSGKTWIFKGAL